MKVSSEIKETNVERVFVEICKEDYAERVENQLKKIRRTAQVHGFRVGMVPMGMIKKMYEKSVVNEEILDIANKELSKYLEDNKKEIIFQPLLDEEDSSLNFENPDDFKFVFECAIHPQFEINYANLPSMSDYKIIVSDEEQSKMENEIRKRHGNYIFPETIENSDDDITVQYGEGKEGHCALKDFTEEVANLFNGKKIDDVVKVDLNKAFINENALSLFLKAADKDLKEVENQDLTYELTVKIIGRMNEAELSDSFFKAAYPDGNVTTEEEFHNAVRNEISKNWDEEIFMVFMNKLKLMLIEKTDVNFPIDFTKKFILKYDEKVTKESVENIFPNYLNELKWQLIVDKVVKEEEIKVSEEELRETIRQRYFKAYFSNFNYDMIKANLDQFVDTVMQNEDQVKLFYQDLIDRKTILAVRSKIQMEEQFVTVEQFMEILRGEHSQEEKADEQKEEKTVSKTKKVAKPKKEKAEEEPAVTEEAAEKPKTPKKTVKKSPKKTTDE